MPDWFERSNNLLDLAQQLARLTAFPATKVARGKPGERFREVRGKPGS